jgi:hypothetical protein
MQHMKAKSARAGSVPSAMAGGLPIVNVWYNGHSIGLYRVKQVDARAMVLKHGAISFPVGTLLDVVDFQRLLPTPTPPRLNATVVDNNRSGIRLSW